MIVFAKDSDCPWRDSEDSGSEFLNTFPVGLYQFRCYLFSRIKLVSPKVGMTIKTQNFLCNDVITQRTVTVSIRVK